MKLLNRILSGHSVTRRYVEVGCSIGDALTHGYAKESIDFDKLLRNFVELEEEYVRRGFRTVPMEDFAEFCNGFNSDLLRKLERKRDEGEEPVFYARGLVNPNPNSSLDSLEFS